MTFRAKPAVLLTIVAVVLTLVLSPLFWWPEAAAATAELTRLDPMVWKWGLMAAAVATGVSTLAAAYAVATVGSAAVGALAEKPELFGRLLVLVGLAEGIAIYGLIISILIINRLI
ncbi:MAG: ATP synthase subunit C [Nitrospirota bacterium]|jgi:V/A-type H+-transporting ATPase subunit K